MSKIFSTVLVASAMALMPETAMADPPGTLINVPKHRHFIMTPNGDLAQIGPDICEDPDLQEAFNQFHYNVHRSASSPSSPSATLGPQNGAPGLSNDLGAELVVMGGCG